MNRLILMCGLMFLSISTWAQTRAVTGTIKGNQADSILIGATIAEKGTPNVVESDESGNFSIMVSDTGKVVLIVTYSTGGYKTKEIEVGSQSNVTVQMEDDVQQMEEVVIVGYGVVKKSDLTGSVASVKPEELAKVPTSNVMESVQGKVAGVDVTRTSGSAGAKPMITIRGNRSITAGNDPLYIVDGVQYSNIEDINSNDVQSMEVLKDASSTAIYGSRGSNGVVIITTKKGKYEKDNNKLKVYFNAYTGMSQAAGFPSAVTGEEFANLKRQAKSNRKTTSDTLLSDDQVFKGTDELKYVRDGKYTDYVKELLHKGYQQNVQFGVAGATEKMSSYFSLDYYNEKGVLKMDEMKRYTARLNLDYKLNKVIKVGTQTQLTHYVQTRRVNPMPRSFLVTPIGPAYDTTGKLIMQPFGLAQINPLADEQKDAYQNDVETTRLFPTIYAEAAPLKGLTLRANFSFNIGNSNNAAFSAAKSIQNFTAAKNSASIDHDRVNNKNWQFIANYLKQIKDHSVTLTGLSELVEYRTLKFNASGTDLPLDYQLYHNLGATPAANVTISSGYEKSAIASFAGRANYGFKSKYLLTATGRFDGASVLAEGNQWDFFPSVAGAWRIAEEKFLKNQKIFSEIKLRASYGVAGNSGVNPYSSQSRLSRIPYAWDETGAIGYAFSTQLGNSNLKWEKSKTIDVGLDIAILNNRIQFTGDYYQTNTSDLLLKRTLPGSSGSISMLDNVGNTLNKGIELAVTSTNIRKNDFTWASTFTYMKNNESVTKIVGDVSVLNIGTTTRPQYLVKGSPVNSFYDYEKIGIWQSDEVDEATKYKSSPGEVKVKDQNNDGVIDANDRVVVGSNTPKFSLGLNNNFKYKSFELSFYLYTRVGQMLNLWSGATIYDQSATNGSANIGSFDYWTPENPSNDLPRPGSSGNFINTIGYQNGSFLKLRSVNISYNLPKGVAKKYFKAENVKVYATGKNLLTFGKIKNYDPEMNGGFTNPLVRLYTVGINVEF